MKEMNRREFLTLSGAAIVALSLAGCGAPSAPPAPAAPTGREAKVLEAINLFRKEKGWGALKLDDGLNAVAEEAVKFALGTIEEDDLLKEIWAIATHGSGPYVRPRFPIGVIDKGVPEMLYDDDIEVMKNALLALQPADTSDNIGTEKVTLVGIKVFTGNDGKLYWVAIAAEGKK